MSKLSTSVSAALALSFAIATAVPAVAAPVFTPKVPAASAEVIQVQSGPRRNHFERRGNNYYYNGHRGYRDRRPGYRYYNGWWFPPAAFALGAIIGGAIASQPAHGLSSAHVRWCQNRWRSYRASDNTYQPYHGPRRACVSPYS